MRFVLPYVSTVSLIKIDVMSTEGNRTIRIILEIVKLVATALLGYFGGNAVL